MKNTIRLVMALSLCALTFVGCTKDEDAKFEKNIVGTWQQTRYWYLDASSGQYEGEEDETEEYSFRSNGSGTCSWKDPEWESASGEAGFRYTIVDNKIRLAYVDLYDAADKLVTEIYTIETISSKKMMWIDEDGDKMEFKKIK